MLGLNPNPRASIKKTQLIEEPKRISIMRASVRFKPDQGPLTGGDTTPKSSNRINEIELENGRLKTTIQILTQKLKVKDDLT